MGTRAPRRTTIALAAAAALASTGSVYVGARNLLSGQADAMDYAVPPLENLRRISADSSRLFLARTNAKPVELGL